MSRPPNPSDRVLKLMIEPARWQFDLVPLLCGEQKGPLAIHAHAQGPVESANGRRRRKRHTSEILVMITNTEFGDAELKPLQEEMAKDRLIQGMDMTVLWLVSDYEKKNAFDEIDCPAKVDLGIDDLGRYTIAAHFDSPWPVELGLDIFRKQLFDPTSVTHSEWRLLQILLWISPDLEKALNARINAASVRVCNAQLGAWLAPREGYKLFAGSGIMNRMNMLKALTDLSTGFKKEDHLCVIFADGDPADENDPGVPAQVSTINTLLKNAQTTPELPGKAFSARQVLHIMAVAANRRKAQQRYKDLWEYVYEDLAIPVPEQPVVQRA